VRHVILVCSSIWTIWLAAFARADIVTIGPSKDASIYAANVNNSNGAGPGMFAGTDAGPSRIRSLLAFDIAGVPQLSGATITGVQLTLTLGMVPGGSPPAPSPEIVDLHRLTADWGEGTTGSSSTTIGGTGGGFAANTGDATWNARMFSGTLWSTAGGDFSATASASLSVGNTINTSFTWASTPTLVADVQGWLDSPATNFGWELINTDEISARTFRAFYTREASTAAFRPQLQITYAVPEPACILLSILGGVAASVIFTRCRSVYV
jgi:hypothetical protein